MFWFNLVTSSLSQFSACKISSFLPASGTTTQKYSASFCLIHPTINQQVLWHMPSRRYQITPASAPTFLAFAGCQDGCHLIHVCQTPASALFPYPEPLSTAQSPRMNRMMWLPVPTSTLPSSERLPILCVIQDGSACSLLRTERKSILSLLSAAVVPP